VVADSVDLFDIIVENVDVLVEDEEDEEDEEIDKHFCLKSL
jgi:hypothetical protein